VRRLMDAVVPALIYPTAVMASLDTLPGDQRAVLQLVLGRGRSYAEIARLLSINPEAVRERALSALDALGPQTRASQENRMAITDYLLGQLPDDALPGVRDVLAHSAAERAWAQAVSGELAAVSPTVLPEIPLAQSSSPATETAEESAAATPEPAPAPVASTPAAPVPAGGEADDEGGSAGGGRRSRLRRRSRADRGGATPPPAAPGDDDEGREERPSSRRGGMVVIGIGVIVIIVVLVLVFKGSGSSQNHPGTSSTAASAPATLTNATTSSTASTVAATGTGATTTSASSSTTAAAGTTGGGKLHQINLNPPADGPQPDAVGIADIIPQGSANEVAIVAQHITPNTKKPPNAYEVWLYNSPTDAVSLGFVNPGVGAKGKLVAAGKWPSDALHYKYLIVTVETTDAPKQPGPTVLQGLTAAAGS
jgi:hypothetical protein